MIPSIKKNQTPNRPKLRTPALEKGRGKILKRPAVSLEQENKFIKKRDHTYQFLKGLA